MSNNERPQRAQHVPFPKERRHTPKNRATAGTLGWPAELQQSGAWSRLSRATQRQRENTTINLSPDVVKVSHQRAVREPGPPATQQGLGPAKQPTNAVAPASTSMGDVEAR